MQRKWKELELYVHIPFCVRKCHYCDFLSAPASEKVQRAYLEQLIREIRGTANNYSDYKVRTLFIGGGTPSVLAPFLLSDLMGQLGASFHIAPDAEVTIEANPGTLDADKLQTYRRAGINRLSIGLQSADEEELKLLGRIHTFGQFEQNYRAARELGFKNINIDLISSIPGQKISTYERTLQKALKFRPEHISAYSLMIEEGTPFFDRYSEADRMREKGKEQSLLPSEDTERQMYVMTNAILKAAGYVRYEISNYALPGYACRHNTGYWTRKNYLGLGLGAASMIENVRFFNTPDLQEYLAWDFTDMSAEGRYRERKVLDKNEQMEEFMFLGLRMTEGIAAQEFFRLFRVSVEEVYGGILNRQLRERLIEKTAEGYRLTDYGIDVSNYVMAQYLLSV